MKKENVLVTLILFIAVIFRIWNLQNVPPSLTPDEAALGYNAYSILTTAKDEHGKFLPFIFKSFGDYKPGLYVYLTVPFVYLMGLNEISVRLPSALAGVLIVYLLYALTKKLFPTQKTLPVCIGLVAALNPYLIYFSRGAWEANVSLALSLAAIWYFIASFKVNKYILVSAAFFSLTLLTYQGAKMSSVVLILLLIICFWDQFQKINPKYLLWSLIIGIMVGLPVIFSLIYGQASRLTIFSIFSYPRPLSETETYSGSLFYIFHSDTLNYIRMIMSRWFNFYSGQFLFFSGDLANPVHTPPYQGVLLLVDLILLPLGMLVALKSKLRSGNLFFLLWLLLAPFSAAISRDQTNAVRSLGASIPMIYLISLGMNNIFFNLKASGALVMKTALLGFYILSIVYAVDAYFVHLPKHNSNYWRYGYKQAVQSVTAQQKNFNKIVFEQSFNQPYIYFLFYNKYPPAKWQEQASLVSSEYVGDVGYQEKLDNINFEKLDWSKLRFQNETLVVADPNHIPTEIIKDKDNYEVMSEIKYLNGVDTAFTFVKIK